MAFRVLVVDDDSELLEMLVISLRERGMDVVSARDAETAYAIIHGYLPDAVLLDISLPRVDGIELLSEWRGAGFSTPVVVHTGTASPELHDLARAAGAHDVILKPAPCDLIVDTLLSAAAYDPDAPN